MATVRIAGRENGEGLKLRRNEAPVAAPRIGRPPWTEYLRTYGILVALLALVVAVDVGDSSF